MSRSGDVRGASKRVRCKPPDISESGSSLVELTLLLPLLLTIVLAAAELAAYYGASIVVIEAASVGARFGITAGNATNVAGMKQAAQNASQGLSGFHASATTFCACSPGGSQASCSSMCGSQAVSHYVQVTTSASVPAILKVAGLPGSIQPTATSTMRAAWFGN